MGDINGLVNKALGIPDHSTRLAAGWAGRVAMLIPSPMPVRVLAFPIPGGYYHEDIPIRDGDFDGVVGMRDEPAGIRRRLGAANYFLFRVRGFTLDTDAFHLAHFTNDSLATLGLLSLMTQQFASAAADFPAVSTVPGLTFRYNPALQAFERSSGSLGPVYVERPQTIGRGKLDVGFAYLFQDFDELDGASLDGLSFRLSHADCCGGPGFATPDGVIGGTPETEFELDTADIVFDKFDLESHVLSLYATYGITDRWDVNVLLPIIFTSLDVSTRAVLNNFAINPGDGLPVHLLPDGTNV
jgi:hypothetical protein